MKWFDEHKKQTVGSDDEAPCVSYSDIAKIADDALDGETMTRFVREGFWSQKAFGEFLGVGESTVAGWMKNGSFPDYAKRATLAAYYAQKYFGQIKNAKRDATRPKVVKDSELYVIVRFNVDVTGVAIGEVLARDIPTKKAALVFAGGIRAWELLSDVGRVLDNELERMDPEDSEWIQEIKNEIGLERRRTFSHDKLLDNHAKQVEFDRKFDEEIQNLEKEADLAEK